MYTFYIKIIQDSAIMSFCNVETLKIETFNIGNKNDDYTRFKRFLNREIYDFEKKQQKNLLLGWDCINEQAAVLYNVIENKATVFYDNITKYNDNRFLYIADMYYILNIKRKYKYDAVTALRYVLMLNNIALIDKYYSNRRQAQSIVEELTTGMAMLAKRYLKEIEFSYKYAKHYKDTNVIMSPLRASLKKIIVSLYDDNTIKRKINVKKNNTSFTGNDIILLPIDIRDKKYIEHIRSLKFNDNEDKQYNYNLVNVIVTCNKVGISYSVKNYYADDNINDIYYIDVKSFYSTVAINGKIVPEFFKDKAEDYLNYIKKIVKLKNENPEDTTYKQILTGLVGLLNTEGIIKDPIAFYSITINGILYMLNLVEHIHSMIPSIRILHFKTDGVIISTKKDTGDIFINTVKRWSKNNNFDIRIYKVKKLFIHSINDKIIVYYSDKRYNVDKKDILAKIYDISTVDGYDDGDKSYGIIANGIFNLNAYLSSLPRVVVKAVLLNFVFDVSIMDIIMNTKDIYQFAINVYSSSGFILSHIKNDTIIEEDYNNDILKYFVSSNKNDYIIKTKGTNTLLLKNNYMSISFDKEKIKDVKYSWYVQKANEIISTIPELFD